MIKIDPIYYKGKECKKCRKKYYTKAECSFYDYRCINCSTFNYVHSDDIKPLYKCDQLAQKMVKLKRHSKKELCTFTPTENRISYNGLSTYCSDYLLTGSCSYIIVLISIPSTKNNYSIIISFRISYETVHFSPHNNKDSKRTWIPLTASKDEDPIESILSIIQYYDFKTGEESSSSVKSILFPSKFNT